MLKRISFGSSLMMLSLALLPNLSIVSLPHLAQAQTIKSNNQESIRPPDLRRATNDIRGTGTTLEAPGRRTPGGSRGDCNNSLLENFTQRESSGTRSATIQSPLRREPGSSRGGDCNFAQASLTALLPRDLLGVTASTSPTLFFALPAIPPSTTVEFVLRDQNDQLVYETTFKGTDQSGIMSLKLPSQIKEDALKSNQEYHWYLSVIWNPKDRSHDMVVEGLLKRVELSPAITQQLAQADLVEKVKLYQSQNLWQETVGALVELKRSHPDDPAVLALWKQVLNSADLDEAIAQESLQ